MSTPSNRRPSRGAEEPVPVATIERIAEGYVTKLHERLSGKNLLHLANLSLQGFKASVESVQQQSAAEVTSNGEQHRRRLDACGLGALRKAIRSSEDWSLVRDLVDRIEGLSRDQSEGRLHGEQGGLIQERINEARLLWCWRISCDFYVATSRLRRGENRLEDSQVLQAAEGLAEHLNRVVFGGSKVAFAEPMSIQSPDESRHDFQPAQGGWWRPVSFRFDAKGRRINAVLITDQGSTGTLGETTR